ncbi:diaminopimelate epimerase [Effusibacillus dendaii]|uniref:Diaminopimelate epimerase n=1 Tax=Effusibacillus dendaii TaxID=2743772 RepID=A0A7I8D958_9BACL|nr:diaminopimelate epimerase [Effusibacillus dendaii]BCJ86537.1 diaminopimelate epimerase [Effusibacillus dendaii]
MAQFKFTKMHGLGNTYIYVNLFEETLQEAELASLAVQVSNVNTGIGSDGMILIGPSDKADFRMRVFNNDGSEAKNCGNGLRCVAKYVYDRGLTDKRNIQIETLGGNVEAQIHLGTDGKTESVTVDMGMPRLTKQEIPMLGNPDSKTIEETFTFHGMPFAVTAVSMGNPHAVIFVDDADAVDVERIGPVIEFDERFPERVNVEFIEVVSRNEIIFRVWERGSGITQACGTGACAAVVAGVLTEKTDCNVLVHLLGGDLQIEWREDGRIYMTGPANFICDGIFYR